MVAYEFQHRPQSLMGHNFASMSVGQFVELPIAEFSTFVFDLDAAIRVANHDQRLPVLLENRIEILRQAALVLASSSRD
jgi:hypothetical protein